MNTLNPYRRAASIFIRRLLWDACPNSWESRKKMRSILNSHVNERCVILCNGPSLLKVDFDVLRDSNVYTFGLNKINLLFDKVDFRPSSIVAVNPFVIEQNVGFYNKTTIPVFLDSIALLKGVKSRQETHFLHSSCFNGEFAENCSISINQGFTVTYVAMQLAYHMGFTDVALVGCDHDFVTKGPANLTVLSKDTDPNHFDPNYFSGGVKWQLPDLVQSENSYSLAKQKFEGDNRRIVNCTDGGELAVFPRMRLKTFLNVE